MGRKEIQQFLEKKETYDKVLEIIENGCQFNGTHLGNYCDHNLLAGGAVANTIHYLLHETEFNQPVINDVDIFCFRHIDGSREGFYFNEESFINQTINEPTDMGGYDYTIHGANSEQIVMANSQRFGIINEINIDVYLQRKEFVTTDYYRTLLNNFDLNCTSAALDRVNGKIIYTTDFVRFLLSNQIEVTNTKQPLQTALRMDKKSYELKTDRSNFEDEISLLQHSFLFNNKLILGPLWINKAKENKEFLSKYFKAYRHETNNDLIYYSSKPFELRPYTNYFRINNNSSLLGFWDLFVRKRDKQKLKKIISFYDLKCGPNIKSDKMVWGLNKNHPKTERVKNVVDFMVLLNSSPSYFDTDFEVEDLIIINNFFISLRGNHINIKPFITKNIKEQIKFVHYFNRNFKNKKYPTLIKTGIIHRILQTSYASTLTLNVLDKVKIFNKELNNLWIKPKNKYLFKHNFRKI